MFCKSGIKERAKDDMQINRDTELIFVFLIFLWLLFTTFHSFVDASCLAKIKEHSKRLHDLRKLTSSDNSRTLSNVTKSNWSGPRSCITTQEIHVFFSVYISVRLGKQNVHEFQFKKKCLWKTKKQNNKNKNVDAENIWRTIYFLFCVIFFSNNNMFSSNFPFNNYNLKIYIYNFYKLFLTPIIQDYILCVIKLRPVTLLSKRSFNCWTH